MSDPSAAGAVPEPLLDDGVLATIASLQRPGAPDLVARVLGLFAEDAPRHVAGVAEGVASFDAERVRTAAHTLKSSAGNVGALRLAARCAHIERAAREANLVACVALSDALDALLAETLEALERRHGAGGRDDRGERDGQGGTGADGQRAA